MTTARFRSFLNTKHHEESSSKPSIIAKRSTISFSSRHARNEDDSVAVQSQYPDSVKRSSTLSKVKRIGTLLTRSNSNGRHKKDILLEERNVQINARSSPLTIDTTLSLKPSSTSINSGSSSNIVANSTVSSDDSEEENIVTPTQSHHDPTFFMNGSEKILMDDNDQQDTFRTTSFKQELYTLEIAPIVVLNHDEQESSSKIEIDLPSPMTDDHETFFDAKVELGDQNDFMGSPTTALLSSASNTRSVISLVRSELQLAFELVDKELEEDFDLRHSQMLQNIHAKRIYTF